jgi:hypothetical protein
MYESVGINNRFVIYPNVAHTITTQMFEDIYYSFLRDTRAEIHAMVKFTSE